MNGINGNPKHLGSYWDTANDNESEVNGHIDGDSKSNGKLQEWESLSEEESEFIP